MISNQIKTCCFLFLLLSSSALRASLLPKQSESPYRHLVEINSEWQHHQDALPNTKEIKFKSDVDRIQYHLHHVIAYLSSHDLPASNKAKQNRLHLLSELQQYADKKVFPTNLYHTQRTPYFIDDYGVHCAVGYLIKISGHGDLANQIKQEHNYDYIRDIKTPGVKEWAEIHGFTLDELAWIQPGYSVDVIITDVYKTDKGFVQGSILDAEEDALISFGTFDEVSGAAINGLVVTKNFLQTEFSDGFKGDVLDANGKLKDLLVCGSLYVEDDTAALGYFSNKKWKYFTSPNPILPYAVKVHRLNDHAAFLVLSDNDTSLGNCELWSIDLRNGTAFKNLNFNGAINVIESTSKNIFLGGDLYDIEVFHENDTTYLQPSVLLSYTNGAFSQMIRGYNGLIDVRSLHPNETGYYIGTKTFYDENSNSKQPQLMLLEHDSIKTVLTRGDFTIYPEDSEYYGDFTIDVLSMYRNRYLMLGGQIMFRNGMIGSGDIVGFDIVKNGLFHSNSGGNNGVSSLDYLSDSLLYITHKNGLSQFGHPVSVPKLKGQTITISPNPFTSQISISGIEAKEFKFELLDLSGRVVQSGVTQTSSITLDAKVASGVYSLSLEADGRYHTYKLMKE